MIADAKLSGPTTTVRELRALFADDHVHAAVIVSDGVLLAVVERADLVGAFPAGAAAVGLGSRRSRVVAPDADLEQTRRSMIKTGRRRLAVVGADGVFRGLLCLKRTRTGFCSDLDVRARAAAATH